MPNNPLKKSQPIVNLFVEIGIKINKNGISQLWILLRFWQASLAHGSIEMLWKLNYKRKVFSCPKNWDNWNYNPQMVNIT